MDNVARGNERHAPLIAQWSAWVAKETDRFSRDRKVDPPKLNIHPNGTIEVQRLVPITFAEIRSTSVSGTISLTVLTPS